MPPKAKYTRQQIVKIAFDNVRKKGWDTVSARSIARELGSSTRPIYSFFKSMASLKEAVLQKALEMLFTFQTAKRTEDPFLDMGVGILVFARQEKNLFRFLNDERNMEIKKKYDREIFNAAYDRLSNYEKFSGFPDELKKEFMFTMWIYTLGMVALIDNSYADEWNEEQITDMLRQTGITLRLGYQTKLSEK
jgi:AcrR family transcriptional regulator